MKDKVRIIGIGIATMDIYCHKKKMYPGGNEYNIAYNAQLQGADAGFMGIFADDKVGAVLEETLVNVGVDVSHSHHESGSSGYALVDLKDGDRVFLDWNKQGVTDLYPFTFSTEEMDYIKTFDVACISWGARVNLEKIKSSIRMTSIYVMTFMTISQIRILRRYLHILSMHFSPVVI